MNSTRGRPSRGTAYDGMAPAARLYGQSQTCGAVTACHGVRDDLSKTAASQPHPERRVYPYLLRGVPITRVNQVWSTDITYIQLHAGFFYLVAVMDWFSRYVLSWAVSIPMDVGFCLEALEHALEVATPDIFTSDQGSQFTSIDFTERLAAAGIRISMDGRGRALDNVFVERLWRTVNRGGVFEGLWDAQRGDTGVREVLSVIQWAAPDQALRYQTPAAVSFGSYL